MAHVRKWFIGNTSFQSWMFVSLHNLICMELNWHRHFPTYLSICTWIFYLESQQIATLLSLSTWLWSVFLEVFSMVCSSSTSNTPRSTSVSTLPYPCSKCFLKDAHRVLITSLCQRGPSIKPSDLCSEELDITLLDR
jgi:hypothetical protein